MTAVHVIVGSGQAGDWAAAAMRQAGFAGRILLIGEEPWLPYERPPLSKRVLTDETEPTPQYFRDAGLYAERGIEVRLQTRVAGIDVAAGRVHLETGDMVAFDKLLIATGGAPRRLAMPGAEHALVLRTWDDARRMRDAIATARRLVCVGAGVIGLEVAASAATMGRQVTVIEAGPAPMGRSLAPECRGYILGLHAAAGVELRFGTTVDEIVALPGGGKCVVCSDGRTINCDVVVAAIGIERNDALAREAGIATDNGILVDEFGRTDRENVYAAGDVAALHHPVYGRILRLESWGHAQNHGIAVGESMAGQGKSYQYVPWFWSDQFGVRLEVVGAPALAARTVFRPAQDPRELTAVHLSESGVLVGVTAAGNPLAIRLARKAIQLRGAIDPALVADPDVPLAAALKPLDAH